MGESVVAQEALLCALGAYLEPGLARQAAELWQPLGAGQSALSGLSRYCRQVAQQFNLQGREAEIHLHIIRAMQGRAPSSEPLTQVAPASASGPAADDARVVQAILRAMERHVGQSLGPAFVAVRWRQSLARQVQRVRLSDLARRHAADWLANPSHHAVPLPGLWPARGDGTHLINAAYVALAEWLGPVQADACLTRIVRECEQGSDAALHRARSYL